MDGNKRIGVYVLLTFLEVNGISLKVNDRELVNLGISLAEGTMKYDSLLNWIKAHE